MTAAAGGAPGAMAQEDRTLDANEKSRPAEAGLRGVQDLLNQAAEHALQHILLPRATSIASTASVCILA